MAVVLYEKKDRIAYITINRPEVMNAYNREVMREMERIMLDYDSDPNLWAAILTGAGGKAFCAGFDLKEGLTYDEWREEKVTMRRFHFGELEIYKPVIAAINGYSLAGGLMMALQCDIRVAAEHARFGLTMVRWGLMSGVGASMLAEMIPHALAMEILLTGRMITAEEAYRFGLVNRVVPLAQLMPTTTEIAETICENGPLAVWASKEAVLRGAGLPWSERRRIGFELIRRVQSTEDSREGPKAFVEKRKPRFKAE